jgi:predicted Zn-dependent peptidase
MIFAGHPLGRNILGTPRNVKNFTGEGIQAFIRKNYLPGEIVIASVGNIEFKRLISFVLKYFSAMPVEVKIIKREPFTEYLPRQKTVKRKIYQTHSMLGAPAYPVTDERKYTLAFLNNILGGPAMNSRLSLALREKNGITYHIESNYNTFSDSGIITVYFGTDKRFLAKATELIFRETEKLRTLKLGVMQMHRARKQLIGQLAIGQESNISRMLTIGKSVLMMDDYLPLERIIEKIDAITPMELQEVANEILDPSRLSNLVFIQSS